MRFTAVVVAFVLGLTGMSVPSAVSPAAEVQAPHDRVVSGVPPGWTPHVRDGAVKSVVQAGDLIILGGTFSEVSSADGETTYARDNIVAFHASTGDVSESFAPGTDAEVTSLVVSPDEQTVFAGGFFDTVDGQASRSLAKLAVADGSLVPEFETPTLTGRVKDLRLADGRLWLAGTFTHVQGVSQPALATVDPQTGSYDPYTQLRFAGNQNGGATQVMKMDITPDGSRLVAVGNFRTVDDTTRRQLVVLDLSDEAAELADWSTGFYSASCASSFESYMRDIDISPDGDYFAVTTTGSYSGGPPAPCDTTSRWEMHDGGDDLDPTWVDYTGGDTLHGIAITGSAIYVGGHFRWQNNPHAADRAGPGAVDRQGIAALDPENGLPLQWNPGRTLGVGVFDMLATEDGLWVASDTDRIAEWRYRGRIAFFPVDGGSEVPQPEVGGLPSDVYTAPTDDGSDLRRQSFDGSEVGEPEAVDGGGIDWQDAHGAFMLGEELFVGWSDGRLERRPFDGVEFGPATEIDTADQIVYDDAWHDEVSNMTGVAYDDGRIFYTVDGDSELYYRYYTRESDVVGAQRQVASDSVNEVDFAETSGMFLADGHLYVGSSVDGNLRRVEFVDNAPVDGTAVVVSGPDVDDHDWRSRTTFLFVGDDPPAANRPPVAESTAGVDGTGHGIAWSLL